MVPGILHIVQSYCENDSIPSAWTIKFNINHSMPVYCLIKKCQMCVRPTRQIHIQEKINFHFLKSNSPCCVERPVTRRADRRLETQNYLTTQPDLSGKIRNTAILQLQERGRQSFPSGDSLLGLRYVSLDWSLRILHVCHRLPPLVPTSGCGIVLKLW